MEVVWSGTLEREGKAPGLSAHRGPSTLHAMIDPLFRYERENKNTNAKMVGTKTLICTRLPQIERLLSIGCSAAVVSFRTGVHEEYVYKVAKQLGIDTRESE